MRGTKAKAIRKYVRKQFPFLSTTALYRLESGASSTMVLVEQCQRSMYKGIKKAYKQNKTNATDSWRRYESRQGN